MFGQPQGGRGRRILQIAETFRQKGATSPDKAMTVQELGLPPRFEMAMQRRLGAMGIFVEVSGKYYLDEARLQQFEQQPRDGFGTARGASGVRGTMIELRMARMAVGLGAILLALSNFFYFRSLDVSLAVITLVILWVVLTIFQFYYLARIRSRWKRAGGDRPNSEYSGTVEVSSQSPRE